MVLFPFGFPFKPKKWGVSSKTDRPNRLEINWSLVVAYGVITLHVLLALPVPLGQDSPLFGCGGSVRSGSEQPKEKSHRREFFYVLSMSALDMHLQSESAKRRTSV